MRYSEDLPNENISEGDKIVSIKPDNDEINGSSEKGNSSDLDRPETIESISPDDKADQPSIRNPDNTIDINRLLEIIEDMSPEDKLEALKEVMEYQNEAIIQTKKKFEQEAGRHELTGLRLWRTQIVSEEARKLVSQAEREKKPIVFGLIDVDYLHYLNDTYGKHVSDIGLVSLASAFGDLSRESDLISQWGADEFCIAFYGMEAEAMKRVLEARSDYLYTELEKRLREEGVSEENVRGFIKDFSFSGAFMNVPSEEIKKLLKGDQENPLESIRRYVEDISKKTENERNTVSVHSYNSEIPNDTYTVNNDIDSTREERARNRY